MSPRSSPRGLQRLLPALLASVLTAGLTVSGLVVPSQPRTVPAASSVTIAAPPSMQDDISPAGDARRTDAVLQAPLEQAWSRPDLVCPQAPVLDASRTFTVVGDPNHRQIAALDNRTGRTLWQTTFDAQPHPDARWHIAYDAGRVYATDQYGDAVGLDARLGVTLWKRDHLGADYSALDAHPLAVTGRVFFTNSYGLWGLDGATGALLFQDNDVFDSPVYADGRLFAHTRDEHTLVAIAADSGRLLWTGSGGTPDYTEANHLLVQDGRVFGISGVFDAGTGALLGPKRYYQALDGDLGVTRETGTFAPLAERVSDRAPQWVTPRPAGGVAFAGHDVYEWGDRLTAVDRTTGRTVWSSDSFGTDEQCNNAVTAAGVNMNTTTLVVSSGGGLYGFREPRISVRSVVPARGSAAGGQQVHLLGNGLSSVHRVRFGTVDVTDVQAVSDRELIVHAPALPAGEVPVIALGDDGRSRPTPTSRYTSYGAQRIDRLTPAAGPARGGVLVRLVGSGFAGTTAVSVGGSPVRSFRVASDRQLDLLTPDVAPGPQPVQVTNGTDPAATVQWRATDATSSRASATDRLEPGHSGGSTSSVGSAPRRIWQLTIPGLALHPLLAAGKVFAAACHNPDPCTISAYDRDGGQRLWQRALGPAHVTAIAYGAEAVYAIDTDGVMTALEAATGDTRWSKQSSAYGGSYDDGVLADDDLVVTAQVSTMIGSSPATGLRRWYASRSGNTTLGATGLYTTEYPYSGDASKFDRNSGALIWRSQPAPDSGFSSSSVTVSGSTVLAEGRHLARILDDATGVATDGPPAAGSRAVQGGVTYAAVYSDVDQQILLAAHRLDGTPVWRAQLRPLTAPIVADGRVYVLDEQRRVHAVDAATGADVWSDSVGATAPSGVQPADAVVAAEQRLLVSTLDTLTAYAPSGISINSTLPASAKPGDTVTVTGTGLSTMTDLRIGTVSVGSWQAASDSIATFTVPADVAAGAQQLTAIDDSSASPQTSSTTLTINLPPSVTDVLPDAGPLAGGQVVTVTGRGFADATTVTFGGVPGTAVQVVDDTTLHVTTPPHGPGTVPVAVRDSVGTSPANDAANYSYRLPPVLNAMTPSSALEGIPAELTLTGSDLDAVTAVSFGSIVTRDVAAVDASHLHVTVPSLPAGSYPVSVTGAGGQSPPQSSATFTSLAAPVIGPPTGVVASSANSVVDLSWVAPDARSGLTGYRVVSEPAGADHTVDAGTTALSVSGLAPGSTYTFWIVSVSDLGTGVVSATAPVTVAASSPSPSPSPSATSAPSGSATPSPDSASGAPADTPSPSATGGSPSPGPQGSATPTAPSSRTPSPSPSESAAPPSAMSPSISLSQNVINVGERVTVTYTGTPRSTLTIWSKTQPASSYSAIRTVTLDDDGYGTSEHAPARNTRIMATAADGASSSQPLIQVRSAASLTVRRTRGWSYSFTGRVFPARGTRLVSLYRDGRLLAQTRTDSRGIYTIVRTVGPGTYIFQARTADDTYNLGTRSPVRRLTVR